jgi:glycosyltransferase involved in cell wall biosynthesis
MRIAFYAPLKPPTHGTPSGDRRVAGLLMDALAHAGHRVELACTFRSFDGEGDAARQEALRRQGEAFAQRLAADWGKRPAATRPELWFTYHLYYKAPDWLGPAVSASLGIPYVIAEASHAPKRAGGAWALGHEAAAHAIGAAQLLLCPSREDMACLEPLAARARIALLPPFLDAAPYQAAAGQRTAHRAFLSKRYSLDEAVPWIVAAAMMRPGDKLASYRALAAALSHLADAPWRLLVAGDGPARAEVEAQLERSVPGRACFLGALSEKELAHVYAACDLCAWPAVNEAYGMALLEAQAAGVPVVACAVRGVPEVVIDGRTGLLAPAGDDAALAGHIRALLGDAGRRRALGREAAAFVAGERSLDAAARRIGAELARLAPE